MIGFPEFVGFYRILLAEDKREKLFVRTIGALVRIVVSRGLVSIDCWVT